jgi:hypothetical protein
VYWKATANGSSFSWTIYRESNNMSFDLSSSVKGDISAIKYRGRNLSPYQSSYTEIMNNDVGLRQRTAALMGNYSSEESIKLDSSDDSSINVNIDKSRGTDIFSVQFRDEKWPTLIISNRFLKYSGKMINDRDYGVNNGDYVASNSLYNTNLEKNKKLVLFHERMNATLLATKQSLIEVRFEPTGILAYNTYSNTTGIQDLSYRFAGSEYGGMRGYPPLSGADDRYYGNFTITRKLVIKSKFDLIVNESEPIGSCCATSPQLSVLPSGSF